MLEGQAAEHGDRVPFRTTTDLDDAIDGADFVFVAIRVSGLEGRTVDEGVPLGHGVLGQETTGPGGICFALRTIPAMLDLAERVARRAPHAWLVNFTNPAGMVTEALQQVLGDRAIGICDTPSALCRRVPPRWALRPIRVWFDYFGLNHLGWLKAVRDGSGERLPELLADDDALDTLEEGGCSAPSGCARSAWSRTSTSTTSTSRRRPSRRSAAARAAPTCSSSRPASTRRRTRRSSRRSRSGSATKDERDRTYMAEARNGDEGHAHAEGDPGGYEARRWPWSRRSPPTRAPSGSSTSPTARRSASSTRARWSRCRAWSGPARARSRSGRCRTTRAR